MTLMSGRLTGRSIIHTPTGFAARPSRANRLDALQARALWWWSKGGQSGSIDEFMEDRMRRHQRILRLRHSRALRRRALWDRDQEFRPSAPWKDIDHWVGRTYCSSKSAASDKPASADRSRREQDEFDQRYESYKAAIDQAIARDPYGTLFGRRLQGPLSGNNSSWTSFSWIFETRQDYDKEKKHGSSKDADGTPPASEPLQKPTGQSVSDTTTSMSSARVPPPQEQEYEYDPISGRKVPKMQRTAPVSFVDSSVSGAGVNIPVKTYKPHKISGFESNAESSRDEEIQTPVARRKSDSIDTTTRSTEPSSEEFRLNRLAEEEADDEAPPKRPRESPEPDDTTPLFTGTAYEARSAELIDREPTKADWLSKEGFRSEMPSTKVGEFTSSNIPVQKSPKKLEPAIDRIQSSSVKTTSQEPGKLETSLDRLHAVSREPSKIVGAPEENTQEDIDLLRASDVRAATRSLRKTKQETDNEKRENRLRLEADFSSRVTAEPASSDAATTKVIEAKDRITKSLTNVWNHVRNYPTGIVAKTMESMGKSNAAWKSYIRPEGTKDLTEKLVFLDPELSKSPSIFKTGERPKTNTELSPSKEVLEAEKRNAERTAALKSASEEAKEKAEAENAEAVRLASVIKSAYEDTYGTIDANHRQVKLETAYTESPTAPLDEIPVGSIVSKPHPLSVATMKPGVCTNQAAHNHVTKFEPRYAELVDQAKAVQSRIKDAQEQLKTLRPISPASSLDAVIDGTKEVRRELHEAHQMIRAIESRRPETVWNSSSSWPNFAEKRIDVKACQPQAGAIPLSAANDPTAKKYMPSEVEPATTQNSLPECKVQPPAPVENSKPLAFSSEYVVLTYNASTGEVDMAPLSGSATKSDKSNSLVNIMGRLKYASKFLKHFAPLEAAGYQLHHGGGEVMVFRKKSSPEAPNAAPAEQSQPMAAATDAPAPPPTPEIPTMEAATVLDEVPPEIESPGPAAPTAPPVSPFPQPGNNATSAMSRIRRQEAVFSGTIRPPPPSSASPLASQPGSTERVASHFSTSSSQRQGFWSRVGRAVRKAVLTVAALAGTAYAIGFVAEGMGAQNQQRNGLEGGAEGQGPRKKIVMMGQRPGIYSTESSR